MGYSTKVRPPKAFTENLKRRQLRHPPYASSERLATFEEDHLVPLELGGSPTDERNLWPQERVGAAVKDRCENRAHRLVCKGQLPLIVAQLGFSDDWITFCERITP